MNNINELVALLNKQNIGFQLDNGINNTMYLTLFSNNGIKLVTYLIKNNDHLNIDFNNGQYYGLYQKQVKQLLKNIIKAS